MAQIVHNKETGEEMVFNRATGTWVPVAGDIEAALVNAGAALTRGGRNLINAIPGDFGDAERRQRQRDDDALMQGLREASPVASFVGEMLPALASLPLGVVGTPVKAAQLLSRVGISAAPRASLLARSGLLPAAGLSAGLGAGEGATFRGVDDNPYASAGAGAAFGLAGEGLGRMAGRVINAARGLGAELPRGRKADFLEREGLGALPSERVDAPNEFLQRLEVGAESSLTGPGIATRNAAERNALQSQTAARAIGLPDDTVLLTPEVLAQAEDAIAEGFQGLTADLARSLPGGVAQIDDALAARIATTKGQIPELIRRGKFSGLTGEGPKVLTAQELASARQALAQDAHNAISGPKPQYDLAQDIYNDVAALEEVWADHLGPQALPEFARLREQYRNLQLLQKRGVVNDVGEVIPRNLSAALRADTGYGRVYRQNRVEGVQPETARLFDVTRNLSAPELQPFRSSGTTERGALPRAAAAAGQLASGDVVGGATNLGLQLGPGLALGAAGSSPRAASLFGGLLMPGGNIAGRAGAESNLINLLLEQSLNEQNKN